MLESQLKSEETLKRSNESKMYRTHCTHCLRLKAKNGSILMIELMVSGGLGNQMFEYAAARCIQIERKEKMALNTYLYRRDKAGRGFSLDHFKLNDDICVYDKPRVIIRFLGLIGNIRFKGKLRDVDSIFALTIGRLINAHIWRSRSFKPIRKNSNIIYGYFQSEKYFSTIEPQLKEELRVKEETTGNNQEIIEDILVNESVCIHIRRGDYIKENLVVCTLDYYHAAIDYMKRKLHTCKFFVFSDDIEWVKDNLDLPQAVFITEDNKDYQELELMYHCKHFIISNSSFSWWAQYLSNNENKIVIAPDKWMPDEESRDPVFMDNWIIVSQNGVIL